jgi:serine/threonine-protein kinase
MRKLFLGLLKALIFCCFLLSLTIFSGIATYRYIFAVGEVEIPDLLGKDLDYASNILTERHLHFRVVERQIDAKIPRDHILAQDPEPGTKSAKNAIVRISVSNGIETVTLPDVTGKSWEQSRRLIRQNQFRIGDVAYAHSNESPVDTIVTQSPRPGSDVNLGERIDLLVSRGARKKVMVMPDLVEERLEYALQVIHRLGLVLNTVAREDYPYIPPDTVLSHSPKAGALVEEQNMVTFVVSRNGSSGGRGGANQQAIQYYTLEYTVPPGSFERDVAVVVKNVEGVSEMFREFVAPGRRVTVRIPLVGPTVAEVWLDGTLDSVQRLNAE